MGRPKKNIEATPETTTQEDVILTPDEDIDLAAMVEHVEEDNEDISIPCRTDASFRDYVLGHLEDDETDIRGNPTVDGLRRLSEKFVGEIVEISPIFVDPASESNKYTATYTVQVSYYTPIGIKKFSGTADGSEDNIKGEPYNKFKPQIAETRAEGRAYKRALGLRKIVTAEELIDPNDSSFNPATSTQINFIDNMCKKMDINVIKFIYQAKEKPKNIGEVSRDTASRLQNLLRSYERGECDDKVKNKVDQCKGYNNDWRGN